MIWIKGIGLGIGLFTIGVVAFMTAMLRSLAKVSRHCLPDHKSDLIL
jgi:hypothetical protein